MSARILIPVTGGTPASSKATDHGHAEAKPSFLLIPALPVSDAAIRASK